MTALQTVADRHCAKQPKNAMSNQEPARKANKHLALVEPVTDHNTKSTKKQTPRRPKNAEVRAREYLTEDEVRRLREAARKTGRNGSRDSLIILLIYRHGLRVSELRDLTWQQVSFDQGAIHIVRKKGSKASTHRLEGDEIRALRKLQREQPASSFVFLSERKGPLSSRAVQAMIARAGEVAEIGLLVHPHMLRHATGYALANSGATTRDIQDYLGHSNIQNTVIYTALSSDRFKSFGSILGG